MQHKLVSAFTLGLLATLVGCGGGGGGNSAAPQNLSYSLPGQNLPADRALGLLNVDFDRLSASVDGHVDQWNIHPALPAGLLLDPTNGQIRGIASSESPRTLYTITAANAFGSTSAELEISVQRTPRYLYATSPADSSVSILGYDAQTLLLERRGVVVAPLAAGRVENFEVRRDGTQAYSSTEAGQLLHWSIDPASGWPTLISQINLGTAQSHQISLSPNGKQLVLLQESSMQLASYRLDQALGTPSRAGLPTELGVPPASLCFDESGSQLFVACAHSGQTQLMVFDAETLQLSAGGTLLAGADPADMVYDPRREQLYVVMRDLGRVLRVDAASTLAGLSLIDSLAVGGTLDDLELESLGLGLWVADRTGQRAQRVLLTADGAWQLGESVAGQGAVVALWSEPRQRQLFRLESDTAQLSATESASLVPGIEWRLRAEPTSLSVLRGEGPLNASTAAVLASAVFSGQVLRYSADPNDGSLTPLDAPTESTGRGSFVIDPQQRFLYAQDLGTREIEGFAIDKNTAEVISPIPRQPVAGTPTYLCADPSGRFLHCVAYGVLGSFDGHLTTYAIHPQTGALTWLASTPTADQPVFVGIDPTGEFLYTANHGNGTPGSASIQSFALDPQTGLPTPSALPHPAPGAWSLAFANHGRMLYGALRSANITVSYRIDAADGGIQMEGSGVRSGFEPMAVALTPDDRHAYVAYYESLAYGHVAHFTIEAQSGILQATGEIYLGGKQPTDMVIDPTGRVLYVANQSSDNLSVFQINSLGQLVALPSEPAGDATQFVDILPAFH